MVFFVLFLFVFLIVFIHLFPQKSASIYWKHLNTNKAKELKKKNHNRMKISTPAKIHKDETGCYYTDWITQHLNCQAAGLQSTSGCFAANICHLHF